MAASPKINDMLHSTIRIGQRVRYQPSWGGLPEEGIVTSKNEEYVFVLYDGDRGSKATKAKDLEEA